MDKEQLIKLAEIAGVKVKWNDEHEWDDGAFMIQVEDNDYSYWRPHEDLNQAFEVLNSFDNWDMSKGTVVGSKDIFHQITINDSHDWYESKINESLPEAICNAILKATEQG